MTTSAHSKSSNSSGFNPILQNFYEMICEIIASKTVCGIFLIFCRSGFINNFMVKNNFSPKVKYLETHLFLKNTAHRFEDLILANKLEEFKKNFFFLSRTWRFFRDCKTTNLGVISFHKEIILYFFFKGDYLILI